MQVIADNRGLTDGIGQGRKEEKKRIDYLLERDNVTDKQLDAVYQEALAGLQEVIGNFYLNYSVDGTLNNADLSRKVTRKDLELSI
ncbi:hypothetical protein L1O48_04590 [Ligilactobacillus equi]|uniref:hypothetical protein n=1 Tax=Ligilactobacillus equi TaxID=137357 RepID=UPI002ED5C2E1